MQRCGRFFLLLTLVIGPLCVGSYFGVWRWPLLVISSLAVLFCLISLLKHSDDSSSSRYGWWLAGLLIWPIVQGLWMWYNSWGVISQTTGHIQQLSQIPMPTFPGAPDRFEAWDRLSYIIPCLGLIWVTRDMLIRQPRMIRTVAITIFWTGAAVAFLGLMQRWTGAEGIYWSDDLAERAQMLFFGTFRSPGIATCYLNLSLAMGLSVMLSPRSSQQEAPTRPRRLVYSIIRITAVILLFTAIISAGSKAGMVFGILTLVLWAVVNRNAIKRAFARSAELFPGNRYMERNLAAVILIAIAILACLSFAGTMSLRWQGAQEGGFSTLSGRGSVNAVQIEMLQADSWGAMGFGPGAFYPLFPYYNQGLVEGSGVHVYSHNDYLQTLVEWGWLGTAVLTLLIGSGVMFLIGELFIHKDQHRKSHVIYMRGCLIALTTMLLHATVDFPFQIESIAVTFSVILGVAWAVPSIRLSEESIEPFTAERKSRASTDTNS